ncbi:MAG: hypothetical protein V3V00_02065 [Saprospiraceae bacterium]
MSNHNSTETCEETPVLKLNFYLMGKTEIDQDVILAIGNNVEYLNDEFEGKVKFELNKLFMEEKHQYLPDIYRSFKNKSKHQVKALVKDIEETGAINIYLLDTYVEGAHNKALMGFTPILTAMHRTYAYNSPRFDRMFIAYPGLQDKSTLVHEMGHFLGLKHPWEMNSYDKELLGLNNKTALGENHMTYNLSVDSFTHQQLSKMKNFAHKFRTYLMKSL